MKFKKAIQLFLLFSCIFLLSACSVANNHISENEHILENFAIILPNFEKFAETKNIREKKLDVLSLTTTEFSMYYTDVGVMEKLKFYLTGAGLRYSVDYPIDSSVTEYQVPAYFFDNTENAEGIIIFDGVPYSFYYDESGNAFVKCLETRFNDYFKEDKPYSDFIRWAKYYTRRLDDEDLLSS